MLCRFHSNGIKACKLKMVRICFLAIDFSSNSSNVLSLSLSQSSGIVKTVNYSWSVAASANKLMHHKIENYTICRTNK